jgi:hypothetical protein
MLNSKCYNKCRLAVRGEGLGEKKHGGKRSSGRRKNHLLPRKRSWKKRMNAVL